MLPIPAPFLILINVSLPFMIPEQKFLWLNQKETTLLLLVDFSAAPAQLKSWYELPALKHICVCRNIIKEWLKAHSIKEEFRTKK